MAVKDSNQSILEKEFSEYCQGFPEIRKIKEEFADISPEEIEKLSQKYEKQNSQLADSDFFKAEPGEVTKMLEDFKSGTLIKKVLDSSKYEIEKTIKKMGHTFEVIPYLDEFPTGEFNAAAMKSNKVENGVIIMINTGLIEFIGAITHFFSNSIESEKKRKKL